MLTRLIMNTFFVKSRYRFLLLGFIFVMGGCTELITTEFPKYNSSPTVNSILAVGDSITVLLTHVGAINSLVLSTIDNAIVNLYVDREFVTPLNYQKKGMYSLPTKVESGKCYSFEVIIPNEDTLRCSQTVPMPSAIKQVEFISDGGRYDNGIVYNTYKITLSIDTYQSQYFEVVFPGFSYKNEEVESAYFSTYEPVTDSVLINEGIPLALFSNELINDSVYTLSLNDFSGSYNVEQNFDPFVVELRSVSFDYYRYKKQYYLYHNGKYGDIMSPSVPVELYSNIENGFGIMAAYSSVFSDTIKPVSNE